MTTDGTQTGDAKYGWPGDLFAATDANVKIANVSEFVQRLVDNDYLKPGDLKVFATAGITPWTGTYNPPPDSNSKGALSPAFDAEKNCAFKIYKVTDKDGGNTLFMATKNFTYTSNSTQAIDTTKTPFGDKGFVVFHKGGDGTFYKRQQATAKTILGTLPGKTDTNSNEDSNTDLLPQQ